jgi:hypothetical protein
MSAVGIRLPGTDTLVGRVKRNDFGFGFNYRPTRRTDLQIVADGGFYDGENVRTNPFYEINSRVAHTWIAKEPGPHVHFFQTSYQLLVGGFRHDLSGVGNAMLTPQGNFTYANNPSVILADRLGSTTTPSVTSGGVGGYFSPQIFILSQVRADATGHVAGPFNYRVGAGLGPQNFKNDSVHLATCSLVGVANAALIWKVNKRLTSEVGWYFIQAGTTYERNVVYNQFRCLF